MSRAFRGLELPDTAKTEWEQALKSANNQKQSLVMLLRLAAQWKWVSEGEDLGDDAVGKIRAVELPLVDEGAGARNQHATRYAGSGQNRLIGRLGCDRWRVILPLRRSW